MQKLRTRPWKESTNAFFLRELAGRKPQRSSFQHNNLLQIYVASVVRLVCINEHLNIKWKQDDE